MFEFVKTSNLALDELAKKDKKYTDILSELKRLLSAIKGEFLTFDKAHKKVEQFTNEAHIEVKARFNEKMKMFDLNLKNYSNQIHLQIDELTKNYKLENQTITTKTMSQVEKITHLIKDLELIFNENKSKASSIRSKDISDISKVMLDIKKQSSKSISQLEANFKKEIDRLTSTFDTNQASYLEEIIDASTTYEIDKQKISDIKNFYREQSDKKYLSIKNDYHLASTEFNKAIAKLKNDKALNIHTLSVNDEKNRLPIEEAIEDIKITYEQTKLAVEEKYKEQLQSHKRQIEVMTLDFNTQKEQLIIANGDAVSLINSKLSAYREAITSDRIDRNAQLKTDLQEVIEEDDVKALKKGLNRYARQQGNELNRQIIRTEKESQALLKSHYTKLQNLEIKFLEDKSNWRILGKKLVLQQKLENFNNEQNYQYQFKSLQLQLKTIKATNEFELERVETNHLAHIAPLDLKLSVASAISEKDVNLLSNDTNYHLNHYQHQEDKLTHDFTVFKLQKEHALELLLLTKEHDLSILNMTLQLSIDKENVIREQQLSNQQLKKDYVDYAYQKSVTSEELIYLKQKALHENEIIYLDKSENSYHNYFSDKHGIEQNILKHKQTLEEANIHYLERTASVDMTNEMMSKDLEVIHSRTHYLFNQIYLIYNIHHHFMLSLIQIYEIPAHPEDVKQFIHLYLEVFKHLNTLQEQAKDQFLLDLNAFQELKINDLTALKLKTDIGLLESEYMAKIKLLDVDVSNNERLIVDAEDRILVLSTQIDRIQFELNNMNPSNSIKAAETTHKDLHKQLNFNESEISLMEKLIAKYSSQIDVLTKRKDKLIGELNKKREITTIKNQNEAISYLKQRAFYINSMKQITLLFKTYENKVMALTNKLDQPLYLTDIIIKEYQKAHLRIEDYFERSSNQIYQSLLKGSVKLFDQLISHQNTSKQDFLVEQKLLLKKLDKQQSDLTLKLKHQAADFKHHQELMNGEKQITNQNIHSVQFKTLEQDIVNQQKLIQLTETKIMNTESNLNKEMLLIDANLQSVIEQMHADFQKQVQRITSTHEKTVSKHTELLSLKTKNLKSLEESTKLKNLQLSLRFTQTEVKLIEINKEKLTNFEQSTSKKHALLIKKVQSFADELKRAQNKKDQLTRDNQSKIVKFSTKIELHEKKLLNKDLKDAKQSYNFKLRTFKL